MSLKGLFSPYPNKLKNQQSPTLLPILLHTSKYLHLFLAI